MLQQIDGKRQRKLKRGRILLMRQNLVSRIFKYLTVKLLVVKVLLILMWLDLIQMKIIFLLLSIFMEEIIKQVMHRRLGEILLSMILMLFMYRLIIV